jgi:putative phosphoesterase
MKIAILSDTHNRYDRVRAALALAAEHGAERVLHCGDIEDTDTVRLFASTPTDFVFGNCDGDRNRLRYAIEEIGATLHEPFGDLELAGRQIAWIHSDNRRLFRDMENSGRFDYLFYGHSHHAEQHRTGRTLVVNPGALHRVQEKTFVVLDLPSGVIETVTVEC